MTVMAPGDESDLRAMLDFAVSHDGPCSIRYPKSSAERIDQRREPIELGRAEVLEWGEDGAMICCGTLLSACLKAAELLREEGYDLAVINARFVKPLDTETILRAVGGCGFVLTVEEGALMTGFGSAVLEAAADAGISAANVHRLGIPDRFIEHAERGELLADLGLDVAGITRACREGLSRAGIYKEPAARRVS
jgi:1-deoxy-D-xylulose-5-phosphate synthase